MARVLIVDDRPHDRALVATLVRHAGHQAIEASEGERALRLTRAKQPDLIITDLVMPGMDGYELVHALRTDRGLRQPAVLFYSATFLVEEAEELARACGGRVLAKPAEPQALLDAIAASLAAAAVPPDPPADFDRSHMRLVNAKLTEKIAELEAAHEQRGQLLSSLTSAQETERARIAADIHDDSLQVMAAVALRLGTVARQLTDVAQRDALAELGLTVGSAIVRLRRLVFDLRPRSLDAEPLADALRAYLAEFAEDAGFGWSLEDHTTRQPCDEIKVVLFRIAQEALHNVRKHARASRVSLILIEGDGGITLSLSDDGRGFAPGEELRERPGHIGITTMRERAELSGGRFTVRSKPGAGTSVEAWVPAR